MMTHQILIASYRKDFPWLRQCLRSLEKFADGFLPTVVAVPRSDITEAKLLGYEIDSSAEFKIWDGPGFGRAQDAMMSGDRLCPDATHYWLLGSDCIATNYFTPSDFLLEGKPLMLYNTWEHVKKKAPNACQWRAGTEEAFGWPSHGEFMRRLPLGYPVKMLEPMREYIGQRHGVRFQEYVWDRVNRVKNFSESNVMGEWAFVKCPEEYSWLNLDDGSAYKLLPPNPILQMWSHGGLDKPHSAFPETTPRQIIMKVLGSL